MLRTAAYLAIARPPQRHVEARIHGLSRGGINGWPGTGLGLRAVRRRVARRCIALIGLSGLPGLRKRLHQRICQLAARPHVDEPPLILARHRILITSAQEAHVAGGFQIVQILRVGVVLAVEELNASLVLFPARDQQVLALALRFER